MSNKTVKMIQVFKCNWKIENLKGDTLKDNITVGTLYEAEQYVKAYVSSFMNWNYEMVPLKKENL
jgi:hypothetical protein